MLPQMTRHLTRLAKCRTNNLSRCLSSQANLVDVQQNDKTGITILSMARPPVNSLNLELISEMKRALEAVIDAGSRGLILTSSQPTVFSAGLDIMEMYKPDLKRAKEFWQSLQDLWLTLYSTGIPTAAAINGASPAGGCLLALSCEYRVMVEGSHTIGLNETKLGIVAPRWFQDSYVNVIGQRQAELALLRGSLFTPQKALEIGLVDELATDKADAIAKCEKFLSDFKFISPDAREVTKMNMRRVTLERLESERELDTTIFLTFIQDEKVQKGLDKYIQSLKKKAN